MWVECVYTNDLVICTGGKIPTVPREAYCMYRSRMVAHGCQLFWPIEGSVGRFENGFGGPYTDVAI